MAAVFFGWRIGPFDCARVLRPSVRLITHAHLKYNTMRRYTLPAICLKKVNVVPLRGAIAKAGDTGRKRFYQLTWTSNSSDATGSAQGHQRWAR